MYACVYINLYTHKGDILFRCDKMVRRDATELRKERITNIERKMKQEITQGPIKLEALLTWIQYTFGFTALKAAEYINLIVSVHGNWLSQDGIIELVTV